jgi:hypothetical protein
VSDLISSLLLEVMIPFEPIDRAWHKEMALKNWICFDYDTSLLFYIQLVSHVIGNFYALALYNRITQEFLLFSFNAGQ